MALSWHAVNGLFAARMGAFPATLDEWQQLSFIRAMEAAPQLPPRYEVLRVLDPSGARFAASVNYLNHPSPYYLSTGPVDRLVCGAALGLRLANLGPSLVAVALLLAAGFRAPRLARAGCVRRRPGAVSKLSVVAGLINNDKAASLIGLIEWQREPTRRSALLLALGLAQCRRTKHTVLLMAGFGAVIAEVLRLRFRAPRPEHWAYALAPSPAWPISPPPADCCTIPRPSMRRPPSAPPCPRRPTPSTSSATRPRSGGRWSRAAFCSRLASTLSSPWPGRARRRPG